MPSSPVVAVLNPQAGRGLALRTWSQVQRELRARRIPFEPVIAASPEEALARVSAFPAHVPLLALGGDGTVRSLLPAVVGTGRPLGMVPLGSGNDFAGMLGLRPAEIGRALDRLSGTPQPVDALWADHGEGRVSLLNGLGMGFDALVAALMRGAPARLSGSGRYAWGALRGVGQLYHHEVEVNLDGGVAYRGPACLVAVMNGTRYGGGFQISPESDPDDGTLDVVLGTRLSRPTLLRLMGAVRRGAHLDDPRVRSWRAREIALRWSRPTHAHFDGDVMGELVSVEAGVQPGAVLLYR